MAKIRKNIIDIASSYLGCVEGDALHKEIVETYNKQKPLPRGYKLKTSDPWCAAFVSVCSLKAGYTDIMPCECGCERMIDKYKKIDCWVEDDSYVPNVGDVLFYDWDDSGVGDNVGISDHVGIVCSVSNNLITVIEGNYSNSVKKRTIRANSKNIRGYGVPKYDEEKKDEIPTWAKEAVYYFQTKGCLQGESSGLNLSNDLLRMMTIFHRWLKIKGMS